MTHLSLCVLGALQVFVDGEPVKSFRSAKAPALLVYLALESDRPHTRDALAGLFWPDQPNQTARDNLRQTLAVLRKAIRDDADASSPILDITRNSIQFGVGSDHRVDVVTFNTLIDTCTTHRHRHSETCRVCADNRRKAVALYCGDFLDQFFLSDSAPFEEWALLKRERLRELALDALYRLVEFYTRNGDHKQALAFALRQLEIDPWREEAHRQAMRSLALDGRLSAALAQYENCRHGLADEMGVEPAQETTALYKTIKGQMDGPPEERPSSSLLVYSPICNLPSPVTPLFGRGTELKELDRLLSDPDCRLISIVGPGGVGKTRLAIAAAAEQKTEFSDGIFFVPLSSLESPRLLAPTLLAALGEPSRGPKDPGQQLIQYLREREALLVLDNFEHLLEETSILADLLRRAPRVTLLVTSRERMNLQGEWVLNLQGLEIPDGQKVEDVGRYSAVQLFLESARRGRGVCSFSDEDLSTIVRICRMVEGMPLAIELAAAWVRTLSCREIAEEIERSFGFLTSTLRDVPPRHRSIRAVFEHSWNLLGAEERGVLRRLSVFQGGFQREAAEQVAGASLSLLVALVDKSLVRCTTPDWYDLHSVVRQFAHEELEHAKETEETRRRHGMYYLSVAESAASRLDGPEQASWLQRLEAENANFRAALAWSVEGGAERAEIALRLCGALARTWDMRGYATEGRRWLGLALQSAESATGPIPSAVRIKALTAAGSLAFIQGDHRVARSFYEQSLELCKETGNQMALGTCYLNLGNTANHMGDYAEARACHEQALAIYRELGNKAAIARTLLNMGVAADNQADYSSARALYEESLALRREVGDQYGTALVLGNLAGIIKKEGDLNRARAMVEESLSVRRRLGDQFGIATCLMHLADLAHEQQEFAGARELSRESLVLLQRTGETEMVVSCLEQLAGVEASLEHMEHGVQLRGAADAIREALGIPLPPAQRSRYEDFTAQARTVLGETAFARAWEQGRSMTTDEAIAYALSELE